MSKKILQEHTFYDYDDVHIDYSIKTELMDLDTLIDYIKITPTRGFSKGEIINRKKIDFPSNQDKSIVRQRPWTLWAHSTNGLVDSKRFDDHAKYLIQLTNNSKEIIAELLKQPGNFEFMIQIYLLVDKNEEYHGIGTKTDLLSSLVEITNYIEWRTFKI